MDEITIPRDPKTEALAIIQDLRRDIEKFLCDDLERWSEDLANRIMWEIARGNPELYAQLIEEEAE